MEDEGLGAKFWFRAVGLIVLVGFAAMIFFIIIGSAWEAWGFFGMLAVTFGVFLVIAYIVDRRKQRESEDY